MKNEEFLNFLGKIQSDRLNEQRCPLPSSIMAETFADNVEASVKKSPSKKEPIEEVLLAGRPYPLVVLPVNGDYWQEGNNHVCSFDQRGKHIIRAIDPVDLEIEDDVGYCCYKNFFQKQEHFNFTCECSLGPLLLSTKFEENCPGTGEDEGEIARVILRSLDRTIQGAIATKDLPSCPGPRDLVKALVPDMLDDFAELQFQPVIYPKASSLITRFDEHGHAEKFKVGIIYQKANQTEEGQFFGNKSHSKAMHDFLQILGDEVELFGFKGYSGGLDTKNHQTGRKSVYTKFKGREIMFHVSTMLPYSTGDSQQLQRKRHIGNDIIAIVFQDENTPFCPSSIRSSFLHIFIVVQVEEAYSKNTRYKITVTAKEDVPEFGPALPNPAVFSKNDPLLREFFLTKLLNAELAAFKAKQFSTLMVRTRRLLFEDLVSTLNKKTQEILGPAIVDGVVPGQSKGNIFSSLRNAFKSESIDRGTDGPLRSKSLETIVDKSDDEGDKWRKKKRSQSQSKRNFSVTDKTRQRFRKSKSMYQASPLSSNDACADKKEADTKPDSNSDVSPTLSSRDRSPSGSFSSPNTPILAADLPRAFATSLIVKSHEALNSKPPPGPDMFVSRADEATLHQKRLNGLTPSPRRRRKSVHPPEYDGRSSPIVEPKAFSSSSEEISTDSNRHKEADASLIVTLRGDLYRLSGEKARLQRENECLREDLKKIKEAMVKQAEDLCESQYELTLIRASAKHKGPLSTSAV